MEIGEEMAFGCQVRKNVGRWLCITVFALFFLVPIAEAAPSSPFIGETNWRTGEIEVCYSGVTPGNTIFFYAKTHEDATYAVHTAWSSADASGCHIVQFFENGQTVWFYLTQVDPVTGEESAPSAITRQTPPITAFIINWPDMLNDILTGINNANQNLINHMNSLATPSQVAMDDLQNAIDALKDAVGAGQAGQAGNDLQTGLDSIQNGVSPPMVVDDGQGTYTGGNTGGNLPFPNQTDGLGLVSPNADSGTDTELTMRIPYMVDMQGNLVYIKLFTEEQMEKMKWLGLLRTLAAATIYIMFAFWLVYRFAPTLKS